MNHAKAYLKYFAALLLFGLNGIVASHTTLSSSEIVLTRTLIGSLFLALIFVASRQKVQILNDKPHLLYLVISGVAMGTSWIFIFEAYNQIGVSLASLAYYCGPIIVIILSPLVFKERMTRAKHFGFVAVILGMLCVDGQALVQGKASWGLLFGILSAVMYAFMVIFNKKAVSIRGLENPMWQLIVSFLTVAVVTALKQGFSINGIAENWAPILILGVINTGIGCYFYFSSIRELSVQTVAIGGYIEPLSALVFSALLLGERMTLVQLAGAALIIGGAAFGELSRNKRRRINSTVQPMEID